MWREREPKKVLTPEQEKRKQELLARLNFLEKEIDKAEDCDTEKPLEVVIDSKGGINMDSFYRTEEEEKKVLKLYEERHAIMLELESLGLTSLSEEEELELKKSQQKFDKEYAKDIQRYYSQLEQLLKNHGLSEKDRRWYQEEQSRLLRTLEELNTEGRLRGIEN